MNATSAEPKYGVCLKCNWEGITPDVSCPRCRRPLHSKEYIQGTGVVLAVAGAFLLAIMIVATVAVSGVIDLGPRPQLRGIPLLIGMLIFGFLLLFSFLAMIAGIWQAIYGRRNMLLIYVILVMGLVFIIGGSVARWMSGA